MAYTFGHFQFDGVKPIRKFIQKGGSDGSTLFMFIPIGTDWNFIKIRLGQLLIRR
ncbi:hypothetical protein [Moraxella lacunata]|uniref:hypothetical protein n=1 Tax=Moraxella lacunata TaxID=477 RepID=UPI003EE16653